LFVLPTLKIIQRFFVVEPREDTRTPSVEASSMQSHISSQPITLESITLCLTIAAVTCGLSYFISEWIQRLLQTSISLDLLVITLMISILANVFPIYLQKLEKTAFTLGLLFMYFFLAAIGASSDPGQILATGPEVLLYALIILSVHLLFLLIAARVLGIGVRTLAIASSANIGGPGVSAPMAAGMGLHSQITAAVLVGILGYVIGTFLGVTVGLWLG